MDLAKINGKYLKYIVLALIVLCSYGVQQKFFDYISKEEDIFFIWNDGHYVHNGLNPYARILDGDMRTNSKYPTYFPLFYLTAAGIQKLGFERFEDWLPVWRILNLIVTGFISLIFLNYFWKRAGILVAVLAALFWQFHAFSLYVFRVAQIDFLAILFMVWSLAVFHKNLWKSMILFGISLAFKQIAIFLIPLFFIEQYLRERDWKATLWKPALFTGLVPLLASLPFLIWNARAYLMCVFFSATREPATHFGTQSLDVLLNLKGMLSTLPMLILMALVYVLYARRKIHIFLASILILQIFIGFNSVLFKQYLVWPLTLLPFLIVELNPKYRAGVAE